MDATIDQHELDRAQPVGPINRRTAQGVENAAAGQPVAAVGGDLNDTEALGRSLPIGRTAAGKDRAVDIAR